MTCSSCEVILERKLLKVAGVEKVEVDRGSERMVVECSEDVPFEKLCRTVSDKGYTLHELDEQHDLVRKKGKLFHLPPGKLQAIGYSFLILVGLFLFFKQTNLLPEGLAVSDSMSLGFVFLIGLVAATSTCLAVAGGLLLAVAQKYNEQNPGLSGWQKFKPHVFFNIGRVFAYTLLGGVIGLVGSFFTISSIVSGIITLFAALLMIIMGLQLLGIFPWLSAVQLKMPKFIARWLYSKSEDENGDKNSGGVISSFLFGGSTFFLPCGFTQALQLYVLGLGDFVSGALVMLMFSLGTLPSLVGIGAFTSFVKRGSLQKNLMTFSAVLVVLLGIFNIIPGLVLVGAAGGSFDSVEVGDSGFDGELIDGIQVIELEVRGLDYYPDSFVVDAGIPVEFHVDGSEARGCAQIFSVPDLGIMERLSVSDIHVFEFVPEETGEIMFSCSMGMAGPGVIKVV